MVFIQDEGGIYEAPVEKVVRLSQAHATEGKRIHPSFLNQKHEMVNENTVLSSWETDMQGQKVKTKLRMISYGALGQAAEILEGPLAGSRFFNYYVPKGPNRTGVTVVGDFQSKMIPEAQLRPAVLAFLEQAFNEDSAFLKGMK